MSTHPRLQEPGQRASRTEHYPDGKRAWLENPPEKCRERAEKIGPACARVVDALPSDRVQDRLPSVHSLLRLSEKHGSRRLEQACFRVLHFGDASYRRIKTVLDQGLEAVKHGHRAYCQPVHNLLASLHARRADGSFIRWKTRLIKVDLLVLDDFGLVPLSPQAVEDWYEIIRERYENKSIVMTSNRAPEEWAEVFSNPLLASAALDRLTHHAHILTLTGSSYRQKQGKRKSQSTDKKK